MKSYFYVFIFFFISFFVSLSFSSQAQNLVSVEFSHNRGFYNENFDLEVTTSGYNISVLYTVDGTDPSEVSDPLIPIDKNKFSISIKKSTVVRVYAYNIEEKVSTAQTYILFDDVINQNNNTTVNELKYPSIWGLGTSIFGIDCIRQDADYEMSINDCIANIPNYEQRLRDGLMEIPTMSISLDKEHIFGADSGIYVFPVEKSGTCYTLPDNIDSWERKASVEIFNDIQGTDTFELQVNAGLQISGASTRYLDFYKHSFKLKFRSEYGSSKLKYQLYGDDGADKFESLQLRMIGHCSPHDWVNTRREETQFHKDNWTKNIQRELSGYGSSANGKFFHLFINGLYWGLYDVSERPDADYMAEYNGGLPQDYDVIKLLEVKSGTNTAYNYMHDLGHSIYDTILTNPRTNPWTGVTIYDEEIETNKTRANSFYNEMKNLLDIDRFIDYNLLNLYLVNTDWKENNWWAARNAKQNGKFQFFAWDAEIILNDAGKSNQVLLFAGNSGTSLKYHPIDLNQRLLDVPEYKIKFGDHIQCHCVEEDGILNPKNLLESYKSTEQKIHDSGLLEFARWGDTRKLETNYDPICPSVVDETLLRYETEVFPDLLNNMLVYYGRPGGEYELLPHYIKKVRENNVYVLKEVFNFKAVQFPQLGGEVAPGYLLKLTNPNVHYNDELVSTGEIYYTTDGSDPRNTDGTISLSAKKYVNPIVIDEYKMIKARVFAETFSYLDGTVKTINNLWTTMCPREFFPKGYYDDLVINEIHYNPYVSETVSGSNLEFLEIKNIGSEALNISNVKFVDGIKYQFPLGKKILGNDFILIASDSIAVKNNYGVSVDGQYQGKLANSGELIILSRPDGVEIDTVRYDDAPPWNIKPDGSGTSLSLFLGQESQNNNHLYENWGSSANGSTPKAENVFCLPMNLNIAVANPSCYNKNDGFINLSVSGGTTPYKIKWSSGALNNSYYISNLNSGIYEVEVTDDQNCTEKRNITISDPAQISSNLQIVHAETANSNDGYATVNPTNVSNGYTVTWSDGSSGNTNYNLAPGENYWVKIADALSSTCSITESFAVEIASSCTMPNNFSAIPISDQKVMMSWSGNSDNTSYVVSYKALEDSNWQTVTTSVSSLFLSNLNTCTIYEYKVAAKCNLVNSNTSIVKTFTTSGCEIACNGGTVNGNTENVTSYSAFILWEIIPEATYRLNYRKNGTSTWRQYETPLNFSILFDLDICADYEWYVEVICPDGRVTPNNINEFTTNCLKKTKEPIASKEELLNSFDFTVYPNPAQYFLKIKSSNPLQSIKSKILINDLSGRLIENGGTFIEETTINIENLKPGIYLAQIINERHNAQYTFYKN